MDQGIFIFPFLVSRRSPHPPPSFRSETWSGSMPRTTLAVSVILVSRTEPNYDRGPVCTYYYCVYRCGAGKGTSCPANYWPSGSLLLCNSIQYADFPLFLITASSETPPYASSSLKYRILL